MNNVVKRIAGAVAKIPLPKSNLNPEICRKILNCFQEKPQGQCSRRNRVSIQYDLHIIIPAYNAEQYILECLNSVIEQKTSFQYLVTVIDDGSTDGTAVELLRYQNYPNIEIIHQKNRGFSGARNRGLEIIKGQYIAFLDSDDRLAEGAIQSMLEMAYQTDADILQGGWIEFGNGYSKERKLGINGQILNGQEVFSGYPWGKLYKYSVLENYQFPEGYWFEDTPISFLLAGLPLKFAAIDKTVYEYRINPNGITQKAAYSNKSVDSYWITEQCLLDFSKFGVPYNQRAYDYFIHQTVVSYLRTRRMPYRIRKAIFILTEDCMKRFFDSNFTVSQSSYRQLETAIKKKRFLQYELLMFQFR